MSIGKLSRADLENILLAHGYEDAAQFGDEDIISLINVLGVEIPESDEEQLLATPSPPQREENLPPITPSDSVPASSEFITNAPARPVAQCFIPDDQESTGLTSEGQNDVRPFSEAPVFIPENSASAAESTTAVGLSDEQEVQLSTFCDISSSDKDFARSILESLGWDLDSAIAIYLEGGIQVPPKPSEVPPFVSTFSSTTIHHNNVYRRADSDADSNEEGPTVTHPVDISEMISRLQQQHGSHFHSGEDDADDMDDDLNVMSYGGFGDSSFRRRKEETHQDQFYDDGVRVRTDPVRMQRLIARQQSDEQEHIMLGRADDPNVEWMVEPPRHLSYMGSLEHAKTKAHEEGRWLFVNIQSHEAWISNELNRTFHDETIECIFRGQYLFWQRGHTSHDGQEFMRLYKINSEDLPVMIILDPNTGARKKTFKGYMEPADLASNLIEFHEKNAGSLQNYVHSPKGAASDLLSSDKSDFQEVREAESTKQGTNVAVAAPAPLASPAFDPSIFGDVPSIPGDKEANTVRVAVKLPTRRIQRRFHETDTVRALFAFVASEDEESRGRSFDLVNPGPSPLGLLSVLDDKLGFLNGICVNHRWN